MNSKKNITSKFRLDGTVNVITGGAGLLGVRHAEAIAEYGGIPIILDINAEEGLKHSKRIHKENNIVCKFFNCDITRESSVKHVVSKIINEFGPIHSLINNAAENEKMEQKEDAKDHQIENISINSWNKDIAISLTGAFICSKIIGTHMANNNGGVILNISSDLGIIAPDQRIYKSLKTTKMRKVVKPVTYSVIKHGLIGLSKYLSTYWLGKNIRSNTLCPGGIYSGQSIHLLDEINSRIPIGRMANEDEYKEAIVFLISNASIYMNGATLVMDGGRSSW